MKKFLLLCLVSLILFSGCTRLIFDYSFDNDTDWLVKESEHFVVHYRDQISLDAINRIIENQEAAYRDINQLLEIDFTGVINYYILEHNESNFSLLVPEYGSSVDPVTSSVYTTVSFGAEESDIAKIVLYRSLGYPGTDLMRDGLALAVAGIYRSSSIDAWMQKFHNDNVHILTLDDLLFNHEDYLVYDIRVQTSYTYPSGYVRYYYETLHLDVYNPQAGKFVDYLIETYGLQKTFLLYSASATDFGAKCEDLFGASLREIESGYMSYLSANFTY